MLCLYSSLPFWIKGTNKEWWVIVVLPLSHEWRRSQSWNNSVRESQRGRTDANAVIIHHTSDSEMAGSLFKIGYFYNWYYSPELASICKTLKDILDTIFTLIDSIYLIMFSKVDVCIKLRLEFSPFFPAYSKSCKVNRYLMQWFLTFFSCDSLIWSNFPVQPLTIARMFISCRSFD